MILVRWLGLMLSEVTSWELKETDPTALYTVDGFSKMHCGTNILFVPLIYNGMKIISVLSSFKGFQTYVVEENKHVKISVCKVVRVNLHVRLF